MKSSVFLFYLFNVCLIEDNDSLLLYSFYCISTYNAVFGKFHYTFMKYETKFLWIFTSSFWSYSSLCLLSLHLSHIIPRLIFIQYPLLFMLTILEYALIISSVIHLFILFFWIIFFLIPCPKRTIDFQRFQLNPQLRKNLYRNTEEHMPSWEFINNQSKLSRNHTYLYYFSVLLFQYFSKCWSRATELILDSQINYSPKSKKHYSNILSLPLWLYSFEVLIFSLLYLFLNSFLP